MDASQGPRAVAARRVAGTLACAALLILAGVAAAGDARAATLVTWTINSRFVDVSKAQFNSPPQGAAPRPPALRVNVLLPAGYDGTRRFPVLYLLHGHGDSFDSWMNPHDGDLPEIAPGFAAIVVMPEAATGWYTNWWDGGARGTDGKAWENYFLDELIPMVQQRLRVLPGRANHAIAGLSMGGEGALYMASQLPGYFGSAASFSGSISIQRPEWPAAFNTQGQTYNDVYGDPSAQGFYWTGHNPTALTANLRYTRLFVRVGNGTPLPSYPGEETNYFGVLAETELARHAEDFVAAARASGDAVTFQPTTGIHDWPWWRLALQAALKWRFFEPVPQAPTTWRYQTASTSGQAWDAAFRFAAPPATLETFSRQGDLLSGSGAGTVTVTIAGRKPFTATMPFTRRLSSLPVTRSSSGACRPRARARLATRRGAPGAAHHRRRHRRRSVACRPAG